VIVMHRGAYYDSCGKGKIYYCRWEPQASPKGVVQLVHGIAEHVKRYEEFASFLTNQGFLVVAEDHMGHGLSLDKNGIQGYFHGGWFNAVADTYQLLQLIKTEYPNIPYILMGHSMGSFMVRTILEIYPETEINGCIISGTGWMLDSLLTAGSIVCNAVCKLAGETKPSRLLQSVVFGGYNKRIEHPRTPFDWLSRDSQVVDAYVSDPLCGFIAAAGLIRDMLGGIRYIQQKDNLNNMNPALPILFIAGGDDPVGDYGNGVRKAAANFERIGMSSVMTKIYPLCRHEVLNEINRKEVYHDVLDWIVSVL